MQHCLPDALRTWPNHATCCCVIVLLGSSIWDGLLLAAGCPRFPPRRRPVAKFRWFGVPRVPQIDTDQLWKFTTLERCIRYHISQQVRLRLQVSCDGKKRREDAAQLCCFTPVMLFVPLAALQQALLTIHITLKLRTLCPPPDRSGTGASSRHAPPLRAAGGTSSRWSSLTWRVRHAIRLAGLQAADKCFARACLLLTLKLRLNAWCWPRLPACRCGHQHADGRGAQDHGPDHANRPGERI